MFFAIDSEERERESEKAVVYKHGFRSKELSRGG